MKKNNLSFFLVLGLSFACTQKAPESLISKWSKKANDDSSLERTLASGSEGQCLKDIFNVQSLKAEVNDLEKKYSQGQKVSGTWKHLNLSDLPIPQANFLKTYGSKIGDLKNPESIDYSSCEDVPCVFNKIYGRDNFVAGYVHYLWYLKFGHMLSADNIVPDQASTSAGVYNGKTFQLSEYLFSQKELFGLWRLSLMLKTPHTTLNYLKEVQRIPKGERFEGKQFAGACGLASSAGTIILNDGCLTIYEGRQDTGYLYQAVTHELSHHVDFEQGRGTRAFYRSHKQDYLDLAGMFLNEYVDEEGKQVRQWAHKPDIKLMTSYAGTSPQENFAESLAIFRVDGDTARKKVTDDHFNFVSKDYYQNRTFENEALLKSWIINYSADTGRDVFKAVVDCSKEKSSQKSSYFRGSDFIDPVLPGMLSCFGRSAEEIGQKLKARIALHEPEGCQATDDYRIKGKWEVFIKDHLKDAFGKYLSELQKDKDYLARIQVYYDEISDKTIAREAYLTCYAEMGEEECFKAEIKKQALQKAQSLNLPLEQTQEMAEMYVSYHSYESIRGDLSRSYEVFINSNLEIIRTESEGLWRGCYNIPQNDDETPSGNLFQVGDGYMISSFYNCLNGNIPDAVKRAIRSFEVDGMKLNHAKEELILTREVEPRLVSFLKEEYKEERKKEFNEAAVFMAEDKGTLRKTLLSDFSWVKNVVDSEAIVNDCKTEAYRVISFQPLYHLKSGLFSDYLEKNSCLNISASSEFNSWLNSSKGEFQEKVTQGLEDKLIEVANQKAQSCLVSFPMDTAINKIRYKKQREACLLNDWQKMEDQVLVKTLQDPLVIKFQMSEDSLRSQLTVNRRRLQLRIMKEFF